MQKFWIGALKTALDTGLGGYVRFGIGLGLILLSINAQAQRVLCDGTQNYFDSDSGDFVSRSSSSLLFQIDMERKVISVNSGPFSGVDFSIIGDVDESYFAIHHLNTKYFGEDATYADIQIDRFTGRAIHGIWFSDRSGKVLFLSEAGCKKAEPRF